MFIADTYTPAQKEEVLALAWDGFTARVNNRGYYQECARLQEALATAEQKIDVLKRTVNEREELLGQRAAEILVLQRENQSFSQQAQQQQSRADDLAAKLNAANVSLSALERLDGKVCTLLAGVHPGSPMWSGSSMRVQRLLTLLSALGDPAVDKKVVGQRAVDLVRSLQPKKRANKR